MCDHGRSSSSHGSHRTAPQTCSGLASWGPGCPEWHWGIQPLLATTWEERKEERGGEGEKRGKEKGEEKERREEEKERREEEKERREEEKERREEEKERREEEKGKDGEEEGEAGREREVKRSRQEGAGKQTFVLSCLCDSSEERSLVSRLLPSFSATNPRLG